MKTSESIDKIATALNAFQAEIEGAKKSSNNPFYHSKYADLAEIWKTIREPLTKHGLSIIQGNLDSADMQMGTSVSQCTIALETMILHTSGQWIKSDPLVLPMTKNDPQMAGSAITYARRYQLAAMLGIHQEDDDANTHAKQIKPIPSKTQEKPKDVSMPDPETENYRFALEGLIRKYVNIDTKKDEFLMQLEVNAGHLNRMQNMMNEVCAFVKTRITNAWKVLPDYTKPTVKDKSIKKHFGDNVTSIDNVNDIALLTAYLDHLIEKVSPTFEQIVAKLEEYITANPGKVTDADLNDYSSLVIAKNVKALVNLHKKLIEQK